MGTIPKGMTFIVSFKKPLMYLILSGGKSTKTYDTTNPASALFSKQCICCSDESPNSPPQTNYYSIKPYSNPSGPTVYNSGALLQPPTLKF
jgi:hypothetical protein